MKHYQMISTYYVLFIDQTLPGTCQAFIAKPLDQRIRF